VARMNKVPTIEAYVIEYKTPIPITKDDDLDNILLKAEQARFFERAHLDQIRPKQNLEFTEPGRYRLVREHIGFHKYLKETECGCEIPYEEAVASWYDNVYIPILELIRRQDVIQHFPDRTEADLYAWLLLHRAELEEQLHTLVGDIPDEDVLVEVTREKSTNPLIRLLGHFTRKLNFQEISLKLERVRFLKETQLDRIRPGHGITCTEPDCYQSLKENIGLHKYLRETESNSAIPYEEAVASWYDQVYMPVVDLIRQRKLAGHLAGQTETDLYLRLVSRRAALEQDAHALEQALTELVINDLEREGRANNIFGRLAHFLSEKLHLQGVFG